MLFKFRRREAPWEVVDSKGVEAVPIYYEDEDLDIVVIGEMDTRGTYVFEERKERNIADLRHVVVFARQQLLKEVGRRGYNVLLSESWQITLFRKGKQNRIEVQYGGRPALAEGKVPSLRPPPFIGVLSAHR